MRRYDVNTDGDIDDVTLGEGGHYYLQDANFNMAAAVDPTGAVKEQYAYAPCGEVTILDLIFQWFQTMLVPNEHLYTGRRCDPEIGWQLKLFGSSYLTEEE